MGLLFNSAKEVSNKVYERFGDRENYLLAMKHNDFKMGLLKLLASKLYYAMDSSRTFILYFSPKGIQEVEISSTLSKDFLLMPWNEIADFDVQTTMTKTIMTFKHLNAKSATKSPLKVGFLLTTRAILPNSKKRIGIEFKIRWQKAPTKTGKTTGSFRVK